MTGDNKKKVNDAADYLRSLELDLSDVDLDEDTTTPESHHINAAMLSIIEAYQSLDKIRNI